MNIKMLRTDDDTNILLKNKDGNESPFDYVSMIKLLYSEKSIGDTEFVGDFSEDEVANIKVMVDKISKTVLPQDQ